MAPIVAYITAFQLLPIASIVCSTLLPIVGPKHFEVAITSLPLTDQNRLDPFAKDGRSRSIMVSGYLPIVGCHGTHQEPYMSPAISKFQDARFAPYGLPNGSFESLSVKTCNGTAKSSFCAPRSFPVVLFSGALGTSRLLYSSMLQNVAATGYLVVSIDHPYDADLVEFPDGTIIPATNISSDTEIELALTTRVEDIALVYDQLGNKSFRDNLFSEYPHHLRPTSLAIIGHSFGGAAAGAAMLQYPHFRGGMNIDGTMFGPVVTTGLKQPFLLLGHENKTQATDPSWKAIWPKLTGWRKEFEVKGAAHYSFSDLPLITSVLQLQDKLPSEVGQVLGTLEGHRMMNLTVTYITAFLDLVLKSGSEQNFEQAHRIFPEVLEIE